MNHKDLDVWKEGINFVKMIYQITSGFPDTEKFGLLTQIRRAAVSVPANRLLAPAPLGLTASVVIQP